MMHIRALASLVLAVGTLGSVAGDDREATYRRDVSPFLTTYCANCHGQKRSKGGVSLDALKSDVTAGPGAKQWDRMLEMIEHGTMPPEESEQPKAEERKAVIGWIRSALRAEASRLEVAAPSHLRRLTNVEYENTMRDLLGLKLKLIDDLSKDPSKPYRFTNTAEFMRLGPEQIDAYHTAARRAMASVIVDPVKPKTLKVRRDWKPAAVPNPDGRLEPNQLGVWGSGRGSVSEGVAIQNAPKTGEFRIRFQASAIFPEGITLVPIRLVMGEPLNTNSATRRIEPVGTVRIKAGAKPAIYEFHGHLENFPFLLGGIVKGKPQPDSFTITPQNLYDDGTLNDENGFRKPRMREFPIAVIDWLEFEGPLAEVWPPLHHKRILFDSSLRESNPTQYIREVLQRFLSRAFRRPATPDEVARFEKIYAGLKPELTTVEATLRETLSLALITPQFLIHHEASQTPGPSAEGKQYALASRLSYFLWASMPDEALLELAAKGELTNAAIIETQVRRMLADPRADDFIRELSRQWLSLEKARTLPINRDLFPRFLFTVPLGERTGTEEPYRPTIRDYMIDESVSFVAHLIRENANVLNIVDSNFACLNQPLAAHYGVPGVMGDEIRPVPLKPEHRLGGLLTHGSILIGNGTGSAPHPIYRAVWLREAILGEDVPPPPADVPALADTAGASSEKAATIKDHLIRHRQQASCNACHARLDPWGIPFEEYNAIGRFQPRVPKEGTRISPYRTATHKNLDGYTAYLKSLNTVVIDASSRLPSGPSVTGLADLKAYLLKNRKDDITRNVVRRLYGYGLGRELTWRDRYSIEDLLEASAISDHRMRDMIVAICQHESFRDPTAIKGKK